MRLQVMRARDFYQRPETVKKASRLALPTAVGRMRELLNRRAPGNVILAWEGKELIGWAFLNRESWQTNYDAHVYVRSNYRNQGVGERILSEAKRLAKSQKRGIVGHPFDEQGERAFSKASVKLSYGSTCSNR